MQLPMMPVSMRSAFRLSLRQHYRHQEQGTQKRDRYGFASPHVVSPLGFDANADRS
jgi:hypothetical protein